MLSPIKCWLQVLIPSFLPPHLLRNMLLKSSHCLSCTVLPRFGVSVSASAGALTGGLVGDTRFAVLPAVPPAAAALLVLLSMTVRVALCAELEAVVV